MNDPEDIEISLIHELNHGPVSTDQKYTDEIDFRKQVKVLLNQTRRNAESVKQNPSSNGEFSNQLNQIKDRPSIAQKSKLSESLLYFTNTMQMIGYNDDQLFSKIDQEFTTPLQNFVDYDSRSMMESKKKLDKSKQQYDSFLKKVQAQIKKDASKEHGNLNEEFLENFEKDLERMKLIVDNNRQNFEMALEDLNLKRETRFLKYLLSFMQNQYDYFQKGYKLMSRLEEHFEKVTQLIHEVEPKGTSMEGILHKKSNGIGGGWSKCWCILNHGMLTCYTYGHNTGDAELELDLLFSTVRPTNKQRNDKDANLSSFEMVTNELKKPITFKAEDETVAQVWRETIAEAISEQLNKQTIENNNTDGDASCAENRAFDQNDDDSNNIDILKNIAGNDVCADCGAPEPDWASINLGVVVCLECSGVHRSLGSHITKVRSVTLDKWEPEVLLFMQKTGNFSATQVYEAEMDFEKHPKPTAQCEREQREKFISAKYTPKKKNTELGRQLYDKILDPKLDIQVLQYLVLQGADVNWINPTDNTSSLHSAAATNHTIYGTFLILNGILECQDIRGWSALHYAAFFNHVQIANVMVKLNSQKKIPRDLNNATPLDIALWNNCTEVAKILQGDKIETVSVQYLLSKNSELNLMSLTEPIRTDLPDLGDPELPVGEIEEIEIENEPEEPEFTEFIPSQRMEGIKRFSLPKKDPLKKEEKKYKKKQQKDAKLKAEQKKHDAKIPRSKLKETSSPLRHSASEGIFEPNEENDFGFRKSSSVDSDSIGKKLKTSSKFMTWKKPFKKGSEDSIDL